MPMTVYVAGPGGVGAVVTTRGAETDLSWKNGRPEWTRTIDLFRVKEAL